MGDSPLTEDGLDSRQIPTAADGPVDGFANHYKKGICQRRSPDQLVRPRRDSNRYSLRTVVLDMRSSPKMYWQFERLGPDSLTSHF